MAKQTLNPNETGLSIRTKINENFSELYNPNVDGSYHVPATGTSNNGKVLKAGATAGSISWGTLNSSDVGLNNVNNTSDADKPISTATQLALDGKATRTYVSDAPPTGPIVNGTFWINSTTLRAHILIQGTWAEIAVV